MIRLNKFLSQAGIASRREADRLIAQGRVKVNGVIIQTLGSKIEVERDRVEVDGKQIKGEKSRAYVLLNKPPGYLVTLKDPLRRQTVLELLPKLKTRLFPVGRLDYDSEGLLLMTNDGELANRLMHPRYEIKKIYLVKVSGLPEKNRLAKLEKGILIEGKKTAPAKISLLSSSPKRSLLKVEIHEGRKREIRRMFEAIGFPVLRLSRIEFAGLTAHGLNPGEWRYLTEKEVANLKKRVKLK
ncbi:MAG: pseudouridine synthase [Candidatus Aminicenantes bacterium]|jgi:pseudouridine synthase